MVFKISLNRVLKLSLYRTFKFISFNLRYFTILIVVVKRNIYKSDKGLICRIDNELLQLNDLENLI